MEHAFDVFTTAFGEWWPPEYTWSGKGLDTVILIPREGGRWFERGIHGRECDWSQVVLWDPPRRMVLSFRISPDRPPESNPAHASEIEVHFSSESDAITRIELEHRAFERHGKGAEALRNGLDLAEGWTNILERYVTATIQVRKS